VSAAAAAGEAAIRARLARVPWRALGPIAADLDGALGEVLAGAAAERVVDRFLRARRGLDRDGRAAAAEAIFGVGLWRRRLRAHAGPDAGGRALLAALLRDVAGLADGEGLAGARLPPPRDLPASGPGALADRFSLPDWLAAELERAAPDDPAALAAALCLPGPVVLRANAGRTTRDALVGALGAEGIAARPGRFAPHAVAVESPRPNLLASPAFRAGLFEAQDEGSQLAGALLGDVRGARVLDRCAGAGGKALQLLAEGATVHACDRDAARLARLRVRAARAGVLARVELGGDAPPPGAAFDAALVDAPCSELGPLRRGPDLRWRLDPEAFTALPATQLGLLAEAARAVRPGGRLAYVTCTFRREEDEEVVRAFEALHPEWTRARPAAPGRFVGDDRCFRALPHRDGTDGFFGALWIRRPGR
jgi:16S rRNA (cytosine967-C5)-methyltransferase